MVSFSAPVPNILHPFYQHIPAPPPPSHHFPTPTTLSHTMYKWLPKVNFPQNRQLHILMSNRKE